MGSEAGKYCGAVVTLACQRKRLFGETQTFSENICYILNVTNGLF